MEKAKNRNGKRYAKNVKNLAIALRQSGETHREIAKKLSVSVDTAWRWTLGIPLSLRRKQELRALKSKNLNPETREKFKWSAMQNLVPRLGKYSKESLLDEIITFHKVHGRIPLKREFNMYGEYQRRFGSWNAAIRAAGFKTNPVRFSYKFTAADGHRCDSFAEKIIDDFLAARGIPHERQVPYPRHAKLRADFRVGDIFVEYYGLAGELAEYDETILKKRKICTENKIKLLEIYPKDLVPETSLSSVLKT